MTLPTLYKLSSNGKKIQQWTMEVNSGVAALDDSGDAYYFVTTGIRDGKLNASKPIVLTGGKNIGRSNETTKHEQAELEARAKWQKKKDEGYTENPDDVKSARTAVKVPMTAKTYDKHVKPKSIPFPTDSQPKLDGIRYQLVRGLDHGLSKSGLPIVSAPHIVEAGKALFEKHPFLESIDGELFNLEYIHDFNTITSLATKKKPTAEELKEACEKLQFHVFDCELAEEMDIGFQYRYTVVKSMLFQHRPEGFVLVRTDRCNNQEELDSAYGSYLEEGHEGQMIRNIHSKYQRKRTKDLVKRKEFFDDEYEIVGYKEGKGNYAGTISFVCKLHGHEVKKDGTNTFDCPINAPSKGTAVGSLRWYHENRDSFIGKWCTVRYQNLTPDGVPRFLKCVGIREVENGQPKY